MTEPPPHPPRRLESLILEVTRRCNLDCLHCYNAWKNRAPYPETDELPAAELLAMLDPVLAHTGANQVALTGGEPLLRDDLCELVDGLHDRGVELDLITNGQLLDEAWIHRLAGKIAVYELPLLSSEAALHDRLSGKDGAFEQVTMAMADLKLAGERVIAVFVATRLNLDGFEETLELALALGVDAVMINRFNPGGEGARNLDLLQTTPDELAAALDTAAAFKERYELPMSCAIPMHPCLLDHSRWPSLDFGFCSAGTDDAYYTIDPAGNLRPCNHSMVVLGNVRKRRFWDLADGPRMAAFCAARPAFCEDCAIVDTCLGGCKAAAEVCGGDVWGCDPFLGALRGVARKR